MEFNLTCRGTERKVLRMGQSKAKQCALTDIMKCVGINKEYKMLYVNYPNEIKALHTIHLKAIQL